MHRLVTQGLMTVVCASLAAGCSEDDTTRRMQIGGGGTAGSGGGSGDGGSSAGSAGTAGNGNGGTGGGTTVLPASCSGGCVELNVTIGATGSRQAQFVIRPNPAADMSNNVITWRLRAAEPVGDIPLDQMYVNVMAQNGAALNYAGVFGPQIALTGPNGFTAPETVVEVDQDLRAGAPAGDAGPADAGGDAAADPDAGDGGGGVTPPAGGFDNTQVFQYGLQVGALGVAEGTVRIVVEGVDHSDAAIPDLEFVTDVQGLVYDPYMPPAGATVVHRP